MSRRRSLLALAIALACGVGSPLCADENAKVFTEDGAVVIGRFWSQLRGLNERMPFLLGYRNGVIAGCAVGLARVQLTADASNALNSCLESAWPQHLTFGEVAAALDNFYATPENAPLPLSDGLTIVILKTAGASAGSLDESTSAARQRWSH